MKVFFEVGAMKKLILCWVLMPVSLFAQRAVDLADVAVGAAKYQGALSLSYVHLWQVGANKKLSLGVGARLTSYLAANQYYITAPASLTSGSTSPLIIFQDNLVANIDTFLVKSPQVNSINFSLNVEYQLAKRFSAGFNIDAIGFSFGSSVTGNYINGATGKMVNARPTAFNLLLVSDNDRGSLNSEMFIRYALNERWSMKLGAQFLFTEYTTTYPVQQYPVENDRFRNKSLLFCVGITKRLQR
jgi:hypothetical protein